MPRALSLRPLLLSLPLLGLGACHTPSSKIPITELEDRAQSEHGGEVRETVEPLPVEAPTDLLPAEVAVLAEAMDPQAVIGLFAKLDKYPEFQAARSQLSGGLGVDLFDTSQWDRVGLDPAGPLGVALLDLEAFGVCFYARLSDEGAFEDFLTRFADVVHLRDEVSSAEVGAGRVFRMGDEFSVILREGFAVAVLVDRPDYAPRDYAAAVATIDPREALSHAEAFTWARGQLQAQHDGMLFIEPSALIAQIERNASASDGIYGLRYAQDELDRARAAGEPPEVIDSLERRVEEERRWQQEREARTEARGELLRQLFGSVGAFVVGAELREDAIEAHARALIPGSALLRQLFVPIEAESPLLAALDETPMMIVDGRVDLQTFVKIGELFARAEGETLASANDEIRAELGIDLLGGVLPALSGAGSLVVTELHPPNPKRLGEAGESLGMSAYLGLDDPDAIRKLIDALLRSKRVPELRRAKRGDGWVVRIPSWHDVHIDLVGDRLIASTDKQLAKRVRDAREGSQAEALRDSQHLLLRGASPTPSLRIYQRWVWAMVMDAHEPWEQDAESMLYDMNTHSVLTPEEAAKVPRSREFKRKLKELDKLVDELNEFQRERAVREFEQMLEIGRSLGDAGLQIEPVADGLKMHALWRMAPGTVLLGVFMKMFMYGAASDTDWVEYERLTQQSYQLREELAQIRQADLDAAVAKRQSGKNP